jgi:hypothetical protein
MIATLGVWTAEEQIPTDSNKKMEWDHEEDCSRCPISPPMQIEG